MSPRSNDANPSSSTKPKKKTNSNNSNSDAPTSSPSISALDSSTPQPASLVELDPASASIPTSSPAGDALLASDHHARATSASPAPPPPRVFVASTFKPVSTIESVASTISALSHHANRGISSLIAPHSTTPNPASPSALDATPIRSDGSVSPIYDAFHNAASPPDPAHIEAALHHANHTRAPRVLWSRWDRLPLKSHPTKCAPLLISYYDDGSLQALLVQHRTISELLCLPNAAETLLDRPIPAPSSARAQLLTALVRPPTAHTSDPQLLFVLQEPNHAPCLLAYSLTAHQVHASVQLEHPSQSLPPFAPQSDQRRDLLWSQVQSQCNQHYLVLSFAAPPAIHVLSCPTLQYLRTPILDVSAAFDDRPPPISLSHRLLAFACTASDHLSPIRSDARKAANAAYKDPSRSFAAIQAETSARVGEMRDNLFETSAQMGDAARRIRGGVISGVRTLGEWRTSYWPQAASPPAATAFSPPQPSLLSQSAPHTALHPPRHASSASSSPMLLAQDGARGAKRLSTAGASTSEVAIHGHGSHPLQAGCVRVIDLASEARTVCTFAPSNHAVTLVSFSPCGRLLLTADALAHAFHVFELPLSGTFGNALSASSSPAILHRYKLLRGITTADVVHAQWTPDAQWIAVGTHSGTVHIYAVNPFGGVPSIDNHVQAKIRNPYVLQPFGLSLSSLARSLRPSPPPQPQPQQDQLSRPSSRLGQDTNVATTTDARIKTAPPSFLLVPQAASRSPCADTDTSSPFELLTSDSRSANVTLHTVRCWSTQTQAHSQLQASAAANATEQSVEAKTRLASATSPRTSGLSQMMRKAGEGLLQHPQPPRLQADCVRVAMWDNLAPQAGSVTKTNVAALADQTATSRPLDRSHDTLAKPLASVAKAEIETYSQSPAMLPSSVFLSRQTFFHARNRSLKPTQQANMLRCIHRHGSRPIQVRRTARMVSREPSSEEPSSFDDSLAGALNQMSFSPEHLPPRSASAHIPSFPQGQRARSAGWATGSSIPIRIVAGGLGGIYRAGKELGRGVDMARRRTSGASGAAASQGNAEQSPRNTASVSFDGVDDVDLLGEDEDPGHSRRQRYHTGHGSAAEHGSSRSDLSLLSTLRNDEPSRGSQPSSAETPSTRFSETEDVSADADADECDWDAIEASRSPSAATAPLFEGMGVEEQDDHKTQRQDNNSVDDDFAVGMFEPDSDQPSLLAAQQTHAKANVPKELVYALPAGGSTRSSLLSQSSGLTATAEHRAEVKAARDSSPSSSEGGDTGSQASAGSGLLCEGSKETHTSDLLASVVEPVVAPVISTSGGGKKKKKKKGGR